MKESVEEYLNRGGTITIIPPQESSPVPTVVSTKSDIDLGSLSLGNAIIILTDATKFNKRKNIKPKNTLSELVKSSWLPDDIKAFIFSKIEENVCES